MKMNFLKIIGLFLIFFISLIGCAKDTQKDKFTVISDDMPYPTEKYIRIGYTLRMWEYEKDGLSLEQIIIIDNDSKAELLTIDKAGIPKIYKDPLPVNPYFTPDKLFYYYTNLQLPIPLGQAVPKNVSHRFLFRDTAQNKDITLEGGLFSPQTILTPIAIASPVKGKNWLFINQSTMGYHFYSMFFINGEIGTGERFAFDNLQFNDAFTDFFIGDPAKNESYFNYKDTLYAVADGTVVAMRDGLPENSGNSHDVQLNTMIEYAGNYIIIDIGNGHYAFYAHCNTNSIQVQVGDQVREGDAIALLGNSGNSDAPHLHFQICDRPDFFMSRGLPFVLKKYTKIGESGNNTIFSPTDYFNAMMEESTFLSFQ